MQEPSGSCTVVQSPKYKFGYELSPYLYQPRRWGNGERSRQTAQTVAHRGDTEYLAASIP